MTTHHLCTLLLSNGAVFSILGVLLVALTYTAPEEHEFDPYARFTGFVLLVLAVSNFIQAVTL